MSLLDKLKKNQPNRTKSLFELAREQEAAEAAESENAVAESTAVPMDYYRVLFEKNSELSIFDSKLGGVPYWEPSRPYPTDAAGRPLLLLCQLNFDALALSDERLPSGGMLQFFIAGDGSCDGRVVYHQTIDGTAIAQDYPAMPRDEGFSPVRAEAKITLQRQSEETTPDGHKIFGTPAFCQEDPREYLFDREAESYDTLLLQIDTDFGGAEPIVSWGDGGMAHFFIPADALGAENFEKIYYHWDCY